MGGLCGKMNELLDNPQQQFCKMQHGEAESRVCSQITESALSVPSTAMFYR